MARLAESRDVDGVMMFVRIWFNFFKPISTMNSYEWTSHFRRVYDTALQKYASGNRDVSTFFLEEDQAFLVSIGARAIEFYDFAEDADDLPYECALLITFVRRDYFLNILRSRGATKKLGMDDFPAKDAELGGIAWLPRLILKAKARLRGELPDELMYGCGGDRRFFKQYDIHPADFLRFVWATDGDEAKILTYVQSGSA